MNFSRFDLPFGFFIGTENFLEGASMGAIGFVSITASVSFITAVSSFIIGFSGVVVSFVSVVVSVIFDGASPCNAFKSLRSSLTSKLKLSCFFKSSSNFAKSADTLS